MKQKSGALFLIITFVILSVGLFLPEFSSTLQNQRAQNLVQEFAVETIELKTTGPDDILDVLALVSGEHKLMTLETGNVLNAEQARQSAMEVLVLMEEHMVGFNLDEYSPFNEIPVLAFKEGGEGAAVLWQCEFMGAGMENYITIFLDDKTGKMVSFNCIEYGKAVQEFVDADFGQITKNMAQIYGGYYSLQPPEVQLYTEKEFMQEYNLVFTRDDGELLIVPFQITNTIRSTISSQKEQEETEIGGFEYIKITSFN